MDEENKKEDESIETQNTSEEAPTDETNEEDTEKVNDESLDSESSKNEENDVSEEELNSTNENNEESPSTIFIVTHEKSKMFDDVSKLLTRLNIKTINIINIHTEDQPLEKIIDKYSDIKFCLVLLNADDYVYGLNSKPADSLMRSEQQIVYYLGFMLAKLGREKVLALHYDQKKFRIPTEYFALHFIPHDKSGSWQRTLAQKLQINGYQIDIK